MTLEHKLTAWDTLILGSLIQLELRNGNSSKRRREAVLASELANLVDTRYRGMTSFYRKFFLYKEEWESPKAVVYGRLDDLSRLIQTEEIVGSNPDKTVSLTPHGWFVATNLNKRQEVVPEESEVFS